MPMFSVEITHRIEESCSIDIRADNEQTARDKVEQLIDTKTWRQLTKGKDISVDIDEVTVEEVTEE